MKIALCIPTHTDTKALFTLSLVEMVAWTMSQAIIYNGKPAKPHIITNMFIGSSRLDSARDTLAAEALKTAPDYLLWLDSDQTFPQDTLVRLMAHDLPIVGCAYPKRRDPNKSSASKAVSAEIGYQPVEPKRDGLEAVDCLGLGVCLVKAGVFSCLPRPWFFFDRHGEDAYFCALAKTAGIQPMLDHGLSMEIGHIGEVVHRFPRPEQT